MALQRISPWAHLAKEFSASAKAQRELCNRLGRRFREAQQEAQAAWAEWDEAMGAEDVEIDVMEEVPGTVIDFAAAGERRRHEREREAQQKKERRRLWELEREREAQTRLGAVAGEDSELQEVQESLSKRALGYFHVDGVEYEVVLHPDQLVYIYPSPTEGVTYLLLHSIHEDQYQLSRIEGEDYCHVVGLTVGEVVFFFGLRDDEGEDAHQVTFI